MTTPERDAGLDRAVHHARVWLDSLADRAVPARHDADQMVAALGTWQDQPTPPAQVIDELAAACEPGLVAIPSGRFFGMVIGGTHPAALAADWLTSAWDQNAGLRAVTTAAAALEEVAGAWVLDALGLPGDAAVGFVTGGTMANFTCLAAGRDTVLLRAGHDVAAGLAGAPRVRVVVGEERHETVDLVLRYLGLGTPEAVAVDNQGRIDVDALTEALEAGHGPTIVVLQAGNVHSGAFDPFERAIAAAHAHGAWVHVDGAFGLWAAASPRFADEVLGLANADSWATDAHKTLNVPYDNGLAIVRDQDALAWAMRLHAHYLIESTGDPHERVPELSRRARGVTVWAVLRALGRSGLIELVERLADHATAFANGARTIPGAEVLNDVGFTQVCVAFEDDARTRAIVQAVLEDGTAWMSGSRWHDRDVVRISVSNWSTTEDDVRRSLEALRRVVESV